MLEQQQHQHLHQNTTIYHHKTPNTAEENHLAEQDELHVVEPVVPENALVVLNSLRTAPPEASPHASQQGCGCCPNSGGGGGGDRFDSTLAIICTISVSLLSGLNVALGCNFVHFEEPDWRIPRQIGIYRYHDAVDSDGYTHCTYFLVGEDKDSIYGPVWRSVHVLVGLGSLLALATLVFSCSATCKAYSPRYFETTSYLQLLLFLLYGLSFTVFGSDVCGDNDCEMGLQGFIMLLLLPVWLVSSLLWVILAYSRARQPSSPMSTTESIHPEVPASRRIWMVLCLSVLFLVILVNVLVALVRDNQEPILSSDPPNNDANIDCSAHFSFDYWQGVVCGTSEYSCVMKLDLENFELGSISCAYFCSQHGASCIETPAYFLTNGNNCGGVDSSSYFGCEEAHYINVCTCSFPPATPEFTYKIWGDPIEEPLTHPPVTDPPSFEPTETNPPSLHEPTRCEKVYITSDDPYSCTRRVCEEDNDSCSLYVRMTNDYPNCETFCAQFGGVCLGAAVDVNDGCTVGDIRDCMEPVWDMICTCSL